MSFPARRPSFPATLLLLPAALLFAMPICAQVAVGVSSGSGAVSFGSALPGKDVPLGTGTVTGHVFFADTNGPARFSKVLLKATTPSDNKDDIFSALNAAAAGDADGKGGAGKSKLSPEAQAEMKKQQAAMSKLMSAAADMMVSASVAADGSYIFTNVRPGTYFVHAQAPGYIDPLLAFSSDDLTTTDPAIRQKVAAVATPITVSGTDQVKADLRLERGAAISGRVLYDDGTPAVGWTVKVVRPASADASAVPFAAIGLDSGDLDLAHISQNSTTDDLGHFRVSGLDSGSYVLQARFVGAALGHSSFNPIAQNSGSPGGGALAAMMGLRLTVYSGNSTRQSQAKPVNLRAGEDRTSYDLTVPLHLMHTLAGSVRSKADGHPVNSGSVELTAQDAVGKDDPTLHLTANIQPDGSFRFDYVPGPATYTLKASHAADASTLSTRQIFGSLMAEQKTTHTYGPASIDAVLGDSDVSDLKLDLPESIPAK